MTETHLAFSGLAHARKDLGLPQWEAGNLSEESSLCVSLNFLKLFIVCLDLMCVFMHAKSSHCLCTHFGSVGIVCI